MFVGTVMPVIGVAQLSPRQRAVVLVGCLDAIAVPLAEVGLSYPIFFVGIVGELKPDSCRGDVGIVRGTEHRCGSA